METKHEPANPVYLEVDAGVRYWEDGSINGVPDEDGSRTPFKKGDAWCPVVRLSDGVVMDWPAETVAGVHYKVCDAGVYWLLDENKNRIGKWGGYYVPDEFLSPKGSGYGDYIILTIGEHGHIEGWRCPHIDWACGCDDEDDEQSKWKRIANTAA